MASPNNLRELRIKAGLRQEDLARKLGVSTTKVSEVERGASWLTSKDDILRWSTALRCSPEELADCYVRNKNKPNPPERPVYTAPAAPAEPVAIVKAEEVAAVVAEPPKPQPEQPKRWIELLLPNDAFTKLRAIAEEEGKLVSDVAAGILISHTTSNLGPTREAILRAKVDEVMDALDLANEAVKVLHKTLEE